ncbi:unnamed protein product [Knipowitschia caucasica]
MLYFILVIEWTILIGTSGFNLDCTHDYVTTMACSSNGQNCTGLRMTLKYKSWKKTCAFETCVKGCCCQITNMFGNDNVPLLIAGNTFLANVYKDGQSVHSQNVSVYETIKPNTPTIISVSKSNAFYQIKWRSNNERAVREELRAVLTYHKKGDKLKHHSPVSLGTIEDMSHFELPGDLEPSTTYVFSVRTTRFNVSSDSSEEVEFTTDLSQNSVFLAVIISLGVVAVIVSTLSFSCFVRLKGKLWDKVVKFDEPKLLDIKPNKKEVLEPESLNVDSLSVEPVVSNNSMMWSKESLADSSGRSTQTSGLSSACSVDYANTEPAEPVDSEACVLQRLKESLLMFTPTTNSVQSEEPKQHTDIAPAFTPSLAFDNGSYEALQSPNAIVGWQENWDSGYQSSDRPRPQDSNIHLPSIQTDMSYHPCEQPSDCNVSVVYSYQEIEKLKQSDNVPSENSSECQSLLPGLSNIPLDMERFQVLMPRKSNEIFVEDGYHSV